MTATVEDIETLRRAAELMRVRAKAATPGGPRWETEPDEAMPSRRYIFPADSDSAVASAPVDDAEHIASWHPAVVLAVADLLDRLACSCHPADDDSGHCVPREALTVARAYLGESA